MTRDEDLFAALRVFLGAPVLTLLEDPQVSEIYVNADLRLRSDGVAGRQEHPETLDPDRLMGFLTSVANEAGLPLDADHPIRDYQLPAHFGNGRLHIKIPPVTAAPTFHIRKRPILLYKIPDLVRFGTLTQAAADYLATQVANRRSVLVCGPTNSGKTSFLNALLWVAASVSPPGTRWVVLEDVPEILCPAADCLVARTCQSTTLWDLVRATMRSSPDRIVVGELRGAEAYPFLDIASSGHPGVLATLHAETPLGALTRLNRLARLGDPEGADKLDLIAEVIHTVVCLTGGSSGRRVSAIAEIHGWTRSGGFEFTLPPVLGEPARKETSS
jgi:type IV secretion system protein VirB11